MFLPSSFVSLTLGQIKAVHFPQSPSAYAKRRVATAENPHCASALQCSGPEGSHLELIHALLANSISAIYIHLHIYEQKNTLFFIAITAVWAASLSIFHFSLLCSMNIDSTPCMSKIYRC